MILIMTPQGGDLNIAYEAHNDRLIVTLDGETDEFDFSSMPDGNAREFKSSLSFCPIVNAKRDEGVLVVRVINSYGPEPFQQEVEDDNSFLERKAEWLKQTTEYEVEL